MTALHPDTMNTSLQTVAPPAPDASLRMLKHGTRLLEPDVYVARVGARQAVFKDYRRYKWTPLAPLARLLVRHEARVLDRLSGWGYAPALLGTVEIGRAHVCTPVTNAHLVCRLLLEKKK